MSDPAASDEFAKWRSAYSAEAEAHNETKNVLDGAKRQADAARSRAAELERELGHALSLLKQNKINPPEEPVHNGDWYSCAVCSHKTDAVPVATRPHTCCKTTAYLGPCCAKAMERSPEDVMSIMAGTGHARGCR